MPDGFQLLLLLVSVFWAANMGASGIGVSFASSYGSRIVRPYQAVLLFTFCVVAGALLLGDRVAETLSTSIVSAERIDSRVATIVLGGAAASLFVANRLGIPQSTSILIVGSLAGAGIFFGDLSHLALAKMVSAWMAISLVAYVATFALARIFYPPRPSNYVLYEKVFRHRRKLAFFTLGTDCYAAFGIGANNVANVVGPLAGAGVVGMTVGFLFFAPLFGVGAGLMGKRLLATTGDGIVPLGVLSAATVSLVTSSLVVFSSIIGFPAPYVQIASMSILAVRKVKQETPHFWTMKESGTARKLFWVWTVSPLISLIITALLLALLGTT